MFPTGESTPRRDPPEVRLRSAFIFRVKIGVKAPQGNAAMTPNAAPTTTAPVHENEVEKAPVCKGKWNNGVKWETLAD